MLRHINSIKILFDREIIKTIVVICLITIFATFYWQTIIALPLFGDATMHATNAKDLVEKNWYSLNADYPAFYSSLMSVFYVFFGELGFNAVIIASLLLLLISIFLFIREITKSYYTALVGITLVAGSPKIILYSARMYQEIIMSALFIYCFYVFYKYQGTKKTSLILLLTFFLGITMATKQQGLFILYSTIECSLILYFLLRKVPIYHILLTTFVPFLIALPFFGVLYHTKGFLIPGGNEFGIMQKIDNVGKVVFKYNNARDTKALFTPDFQSKLDTIHHQYYYSINAWGESKHIWPADVFTNFEKFNQANSLYVDFQGVELESESFYYLSFIGLICGILIAIYKRGIYRDLLLTTPIFLAANYALFFRNADQQRYHIFLPIYLLVFVLIFFKYALEKVELKHKNNIVLSVSLIIIIVAILSPRLLMNKNWGQSQIYTSSVGGINSVKEVGNWFKTHTSDDTVIGQQCGNETAYYSRRKNIGDWKVYLMSDEDKKTFFRETNISYYVVYNSQIVPNDKWVSFCWVPQSFSDFLNTNYKKVYVSRKGDISIYEI